MVYALIRKEVGQRAADHHYLERHGVGILVIKSKDLRDLVSKRAYLWSVVGSRIAR